MNCPKCGRGTYIIETRNTSIGTRRRHKCCECCHRFTTIEIPIDTYKDLLDKANCFDNISKVFNKQQKKERFEHGTKK